MILQALEQYYDRQSKNPDTALAPPGFEQKEIPFVLVIDAAGQLVSLEDTRQLVGKKPRPRSYLVPQGVKKTSGVAANLLWDGTDYVLGLGAPAKPDKKNSPPEELPVAPQAEPEYATTAAAGRPETSKSPERLAKQHAAFVSRLAELPAADVGVLAVRAFLAEIPWAALAAQPSWEEVCSSNPTLSFKLVSDTELVCQRPDVVAYLMAATEIGAATEGDEVSSHSMVKGVCLVTGEYGEVARLHPAIKGVWGAQTSGANIVSFNQRSFESYGKEKRQGENAPISPQAVFAYTTALNHLLRKDSSQRMQVGDASTVFWAEAATPLEGSFADLLGEPSKDSPDAHTRAVAALYQSVQQGHLNQEGDDTRFFVLGLAPNAARISIRFWHVATVAELSTRFVQHFNDIALDHAPYEPPYLSLFRLLVSTAGQGKSENILPSLGGDTLRAILEGRPYPDTLLTAAIRRIRAEREVSYPRAALIKACLNRKARAQHPNEDAFQEEFSMSLDLTNPHVSYRLGRLFAALERLQERASGARTLNSTIRDRFYGSASSNPAVVFPNLLKLSVHHLAKLDNKGEAINTEKLLGEILDGMTDFPTQLPMADQGRFAIGYYHQKQDFYKKTTSSTPDQGASA